MCSAPKHGKEWEDSETLAVAGACMSELMFRREVEHDEIADDPLRFHVGQNLERLSGQFRYKWQFVGSAVRTGLHSNREVRTADPTSEEPTDSKNNRDAGPARTGVAANAPADAAQRVKRVSLKLTD